MQRVGPLVNGGLLEKNKRVDLDPGFKNKTKKDSAIHQISPG